MAIERVVSLISGNGTTMEQMVLATRNGTVTGIEIAGVIVSNPNAGGIEKARKLEVPFEVVNPEKFRGDDNKIDQNGYGMALLRSTRRFKASVFTQNGHLPLTPENYIEAMERDGLGGFNQHPGNPVDFGGRGMHGKRVHAAAIYFLRKTKGEMIVTPVVQRVAAQYDAGVVVGSERVEVLSGDEYNDLHDRVLPVEHRLNIQLLRDIAAGNIIERSMESILKPGQEVYLRQAKEAARFLIPAA